MTLPHLDMNLNVQHINLTYNGCHESGVTPITIPKKQD